jgi:hypothetical protein
MYRNETYRWFKPIADLNLSPQEFIFYEDERKWLGIYIYLQAIPYIVHDFAPDLFRISKF